MNRIFFTLFLGLILALNLSAQKVGTKPVPSVDRAKTTVERISQTVTFTKQQKADIIVIFTKFYDDVRAQQAFRDASKLEPLEKARDAKVSKLLNNPKLFKQYEDVVKEMKTQFMERQKRR